MAARGAAISDQPRTPRERMAEPTRAGKPRCRQGVVPGAGAAVKPKKKAFYLLSMKPPKDPAPNNNNNVSFVIHCQLGKEIKHICSNCSRGEDGRDGECRAPWGGGGKVALLLYSPWCRLESATQATAGTSVSPPPPAPQLLHFAECHPQPVGLQQRPKRKLWGFDLRRLGGGGLGDMSIVAPKAF